MPPLIVFAVAGIGAYAGYRLVRAALEQLDSSAGPRDGATADLQQPRDLGALEWDPTSGVLQAAQVRQPPLPAEGAVDSLGKLR